MIEVIGPEPMSHNRVRENTTSSSSSIQSRAIEQAAAVLTRCGGRLNEKAHITDPRSAAVFANPRQRSILLSLIPEERSTAQLSAATGSSLNLLHHHLRKLVALGLVEVSREQRRSGRAVKYYRARAREFFVPAELSAFRLEGPLSDQLHEAIERSRMRTFVGVLYSCEARAPRIQLVHDPEHSISASELWLELRLSPAEAAALARQMAALFRPFYGRAAQAGSRYIVHAAIGLADP